MVNTKQRNRRIASLVVLALLILFSMVVYNVSAVCVPSLTASNFSVDETVAPPITCAASDKNDPGYFVFYNSTNGDTPMDDTANFTFTVPGTSPFVVFPTWKVTANQSPGFTLPEGASNSTTKVCVVLYLTSETRTSLIYRTPVRFICGD